MILILAALLSPLSHACAEHAAAEGKPKLIASNKMVAGSLPEGAKAYGKGVTLKEAPISLSEAIQRKDELKDKEIVVKARVNQVCQSKGCWLTLKDGKNEVRVTFADYSFFVPKNSSKEMAVVQGKIFEKDLSAAEARHYAKDAGMPAAKVAKIQQGEKSAWFEATGLTLSKN